MSSPSKDPAPKMMLASSAVFIPYRELGDAFVLGCRDEKDIHPTKAILSTNSQVQLSWRITPPPPPLNNLPMREVST